MKSSSFSPVSPAMQVIILERRRVLRGEGGGLWLGLSIRIFKVPWVIGCSQGKNLWPKQK